jgi:hypothetical protein
MSTPIPDEPEKGAKKAAAPAERKDAQPAKAEEKPGQGLKYVFKIAPADPKNAFDFEDVADK